VVLSNRSPLRLRGSPTSIHRVEKVLLIVLDFILLEKPDVFVTKAPAGIVPFLVADIVDAAAELRMAVRASAEAFLPAEAAQHPSLAVDEIGISFSQESRLKIWVVWKPALRVSFIIDRR
jgi:hypothetical protein